jgi:lipopolysaccharide export LptBFGC system permease protein LptF
MRVLRKIFQAVLAILYVLVVAFLIINTWTDYASGAMQLSGAILQTILLVGLPLLVLVTFAVPEAMFHAGTWLYRKLTGKSSGTGP